MGSRTLPSIIRALSAGLVLTCALTGSPVAADPGLRLGVAMGVGWTQDRDPRGSGRTLMRPANVTRSPRKAVAFLLDLARQRTGGYRRECLRLADDAYLPKGSRLPAALKQWRRAKRAGVVHVKDPEPPLGAQMFWDPPTHSAGHVATYVGDGKAVTNMPDGTVKVVAWRRMNKWGPYLGWSPPYYG